MEAATYIVGAFLLLPIFLYLLARGASYAYFRSRLEFERKLKTMMKQQKE